MEHGTKIVVRVEPWNDRDLMILETLFDRLENKDIEVSVFDIDERLTGAEVLSFMPGTHPPQQTPVLAEYRDGQLVNSLQGLGAINWIDHM